MSYQGAGSPQGPAAGWYLDPHVPGQQRYWDGTVWTAHTAPAVMPPPMPGPVFGSVPPQFAPAGAWASPTQAAEAAAAATVRRLALYETLSGCAWIVLGIVQILSLLGIIAGVWNIFAAITRLRLASRIERREATVPAVFEPLTGYVVIGVINLLLGGVIGLVFLAADLFIRDQLLKRRDLFTVGARPAVTSTFSPFADSGSTGAEPVRA